MSEGLITDGPAKDIDPDTLLRAHASQVAFHSEQVANPNMPPEQAEIHGQQLAIHRERLAAMAVPGAGAELISLAA